MPEFKSPMQKMQYEGLVEFINEHNSLVGQVNAATGDKDALSDSIATKEFPDLVEQIEALEQELADKVAARVEETLAGDQGDVAEATEKAKELKSTIASGLSYYKKLYGDEAAEAFPKVERLKGVRVGGGGAGGRRVRGFRVVITDADGATEYENFASAAKALGLGTSDLQEHFFAKAGAEKLADVPDEVVFTLQWEEEDGEGNKTPASAEVKAFRVNPEGQEPKKAVDADDAADIEEEDVTPDEDDLVEIG